MSRKTISIIIFLVVAFLIVIIVTFAMNSRKGPADSQNQAQNPSVNETPEATTTPTTGGVNVNINGSVGTEKSYTLAEVAKHSTKTDCWTTVNGNVYNLTSFVTKHPGGDKILKICGIDGTATFTAQHGGQPNPEKMIATLKIGVVAK